MATFAAYHTARQPFVLLWRMDTMTSSLKVYHIDILTAKRANLLLESCELGQIRATSPPISVVSQNTSSVVLNPKRTRGGWGLVGPWG